MKTLITFFESFSNVLESDIRSFAINWPVIWSDSSIYVCFWLVVFCLIVIWAANNYRRSVRDEYLVKTTSKLVHLHGLIDEKEREYKFLDNAFAEYRTDAQSEMFERQERINQLETKLEASKLKYDELELKYDNVLTQLSGRRNPDGTFAKTTGKGHGKRKTKPASASSKFAAPTAPAAPEPERDWTTATTDELLAEAKRRYPVGTRYADVLDAWKYEAKREPWIYTDAQTFKGIAICVTDGGGFVYANGLWAEIQP